MQIRDYIELILSTLVGVGAILFGIGQFRLGRKEVKTTDVNSANSIVELFRSKSEELEKDLKQLRTDFETYKKEALAKEEAYKKTIQHQEEMIKNYDIIFRNRNPELEKILIEIRDFLKTLTESSAHNTKILDNQVIREKKSMI